MERFELNREHLKELGEEVARAVEEAANEVAHTHSGKPESEVRSALEAALANRGYSHSEPPDEIVRQIAGGNPPEYKG